jgi:hypothetical protein
VPHKLDFSLLLAARFVLVGDFGFGSFAACVNWVTLGMASISVLLFDFVQRRPDPLVERAGPSSLSRSRPWSARQGADFCGSSFATEFSTGSNSSTPSFRARRRRSAFRSHEHAGLRLIFLFAPVDSFSSVDFLVPLPRSRSLCSVCRWVELAQF